MFVEIEEKYVDQKKHQMVPYIIGKAYVWKFHRQNIKKNVDRQKKRLFSLGGKNLQATKTPGPPPRYLIVRPLVLVEGVI